MCTVHPLKGREERATNFVVSTRMLFLRFCAALLCRYRNQSMNLVQRLIPNKIFAAHKSKEQQTGFCQLFMCRHCVNVLSHYYASVGRAPEAYSIHFVCVSVCRCICMSFTSISMQRLKGKCQRHQNKSTRCYLQGILIGICFWAIPTYGLISP